MCVRDCVCACVCEFARGAVHVYVCMHVGAHAFAGAGSRVCVRSSLTVKAKFVQV